MMATGRNASAADSGFMSCLASCEAPGGKSLLPSVIRVLQSTEQLPVTALNEDIWCEKIRGCSYRGGNMSAGTPNEPPSQVVIRSDVLPTSMTGRRSIALRPGRLRQVISDSLTASDKSGQR